MAGAPPGAKKMDLAGDGDGFSSADMLALMNNHELLKGGSVKGSLLAGNTRDADGSIDRVRDPPKSLLPMLKKIKRHMDIENIDMEGILYNQGGTKYGTMNKTRFNSVLRDVMLHVHVFSDKELFEIDAAYGTGAEDLIFPGTYEQIAWMDFCEDLGYMDASYMPESAAPPLGFKPKPMSAIAIMLDAMDGVMDGVVDDTKLVDGMSKGRFLGDHDGLDTGADQQAINDASRSNSHAAFGGSIGKAGKVAQSQTGATRNNASSGGRL